MRKRDIASTLFANIQHMHNFSPKEKWGGQYFSHLFPQGFWLLYQQMENQEQKKLKEQLNNCTEWINLTQLTIQRIFERVLQAWTNSRSSFDGEPFWRNCHRLFNLNSKAKEYLLADSNAVYSNPPMISSLMAILENCIMGYLPE